jgi:hypothetical protein
MRIEKRVRALEDRMIADPVVLLFADGSTTEIPGGDSLVNLVFDTCLDGDLTSTQTKQLELVRRCLGSTEPGGGHMIDLVRCFLNGLTGQERRPRVQSIDHIPRESVCNQRSRTNDSGW